MTVAWTLYLLLVGLLLSLGAAATASALALTGRPTRWVWALAMGGTIVLALLSPRRPQSPVVTSVAPSATLIVTPTAARAAPGPGDRVGRLRDRFADGVVDVVSLAERRVPAAVETPALAGWLGASALLLALYLTVNLRIARARRRWPRTSIHGVDVRLAPATGPAVIGLLPAEIVVPRSLLERTAEEQRLIVDHEREHLRTGDHLLLGAAWVSAILLPWHPAMWYALARLRLAIELDCDARVLRRGTAPRAYGAVLIEMAAQGAGIRIGALALADGTSHLERRLLAMKTPKPRHAVARGIVLCSVAALLVVAACEAKLPTSAEVDAMDVAGMERSAEKAGLLAKDRMRSADYFVNGMHVTSDSALALPPADIGSIEVVKGRPEVGRDTIIITTGDRLPAGDSAAVSRRRVRGAGGVGDETGVLASGERQPAYMIDGVRASEARFKSLRVEDIQSVAVMKQKQANNGALYPDGLINVRTKVRRALSADAPDAYRELETRDRHGTKYTVDGVVIRPTMGDMAATAGPGAGGGARLGWAQDALPAFTIDGAPATRNQFTALDRKNIQRIDVVKMGATAISKDPAAVNGLVQITTRSAKTP